MEFPGVDLLNPSEYHPTKSNLVPPSSCLSRDENGLI